MSGPKTLAAARSARPVTSTLLSKLTSAEEVVGGVGYARRTKRVATMRTRRRRKKRRLGMIPSVEEGKGEDETARKGRTVDESDEKRA